MDVEPISVAALSPGASPHERPGLSLAETCRVVGCSVPLWPLHRERLRDGGCGELQLDDVERLLDAAVSTYSGERTSRLRAHVEAHPEGTVSVEVRRSLSSLDVVRGPVVVRVGLDELGTQPALPRAAAKPADRSWWDGAAKIARRRGGHQAVICDADGFVVDGSSASLWLTIDGVLVTAPAPRAIAGVARRFVLEKARERGIRVSIRPVHYDELTTAAEVLLTNAFGGAVPVSGRDGPMTREIQAFFAEVWKRPPQAQEHAEHAPEEKQS